MHDDLIEENYLNSFDNGICVVTDWRIHNYISSDRYTETSYKKEFYQSIEKTIDGRLKELDSGGQDLKKCINRPYYITGRVYIPSRGKKGQESHIILLGAC